MIQENINKRPRPSFTLMLFEEQFWKMRFAFMLEFYKQTDAALMSEHEH